jgi:EAL domain-containing protein (putative c-di-GMP-specific phosphodiesterase class I)
MGCDVIQGHVLSEALPADAFTRWVEAFASGQARYRTAITD